MKFDIVRRLKENASIWDEESQIENGHPSATATLLRQAAREIETLRNQVSNYEHLLGIQDESS